MPMYEYQCGGCGHRFEKYESGRGAGRDGGEPCPKCGKGKAKRTFSTFASSCCVGSAPAGGGGCGSGGAGRFS